MSQKSTVFEELKVSILILYCYYTLFSNIFLFLKATSAHATQVNEPTGVAYM